MKRNIVLFVAVLTVLLPLAYSICLSRTRADDVVASAEEVNDVRGYLAGAISARAAGRGNPWITLRDGHTAPADYQGSSTLVPQLRDNQARPVSLASADFDEDGVPDLVAGYAGTRDGVISIQRGDVDAVFPNTRQAIAHREQLSAPNPDDIQSPFFATTRVFDVPGAPQFIGTGDFDADGHRDVVVAEIGATALVLLPGDGDGGFTPVRSIALPGVVTALVTGDANRMDGLADVIVAINGAAGARLLVYEASAGALNDDPEVLSLPAESRSLAIGQLDDDYPVDMAVAAGRDLLIVHGRDRKHSTIEGKTLVAQPARVTRLSGLFSITSLAIGDFTGDLRNEIAMLSDDGKCHVVSRGKSSKGVGWKETSAAALPLSRTSSPVGSPPVLVPLRISSSQKDDLLLLDQAGRKLHMIINESASASEIAGKGPASASLRVAGALDIDGEPVAVIGMRLNVDALSDLVVLKSDDSAPTVIPTTPAATFTVINTADSGAGSLRQAIIDANINPGTDLINFLIPGSGTQTITLLAPLPTISTPATVDGTTQNLGSATPPIELPGTSAGIGFTGLKATAGNTTVRGFVINRFEDGLGIELSGSNDIIEFNFIGTNATGTASLGNGDTGLLIHAGSGHLIGGTTAAARNVISANGQGVEVLLGPALNHQVQGNFIGTDVTGAIDLGNLGDGIFMLSGTANIMNCTVGGTAAAAGNVISGNGNVGIQFLTVGTSNLVQGNLIGTNASGSNDLGNAGSGVALNEAANNTVGGTVAGAGNVISGNDDGGVRINLTTSTGNRVQGNKIGTRADGTTSLPNSGHGVHILNSASTNTIGGAAGEGNIIAFNLSAGVKVETGTANAITSNSIFSNSGGLGIDLGPAGVTPNDGNDGDGGANDLQNFPVLSSAGSGIGGGVNIQGTLNSTANTTFTLHFYASTSCDGSGNGEGRTFLGSAMATTVGNNVTFNITLPGASASVGQVITATATTPFPQGSTSEFSACVPYGVADLAINKTASSSTIVVGSNVTYTITLTNNGPDPASSITLTDNLPLSLAFVSCSSTANGVCGGSGNNRTVSFTTLASGASATITIVASLSCSVVNGAIVGNTASVISSVPDPVSGNNSSTVNFTASNPPRSISPTSESYASNGGDGIVSVIAPNCPWQATSNDAWLTITSGSSGSGLGAVGYHVAVNATGTPRVGTLTITGLTFTVNQSNQSCQFTLAPTSDSFPAQGGIGTVSITTLAGCGWKAISNDSWIIGPPDGQTGSGSANYTVQPNPDSSPRSGTMTIAGQTFNVDQAGSPTAVALVSFTAREYETGVEVQWRTGMEVENLGFRVYRQHAGQRVRITPEIVAGSALIAGNRTTMTAGNSYEWWDKGIADCGSRIGNCRDVQYWLEDIDLNGKATLYGPVAAQKVGGAPAQHNTASVLSRIGKGEPKVRQLLSSQPSPVSPLQKQTVAPWDLPSQSGIKLTIREEGWYRVTQPELVAAGLDAKTDPRTLRLYLEGQERALLVVGEQDGAFDQGDAIEFYAAGQDLPSTDTHTFWLVGGKQPGKRINSVRSNPKPSGVSSFAYTVERKEKTIYFSSLRNGDAENFFGPVIASQPVDQELNLQHLDSAPGEALLEIALQGVTDLPGIGPDHQVKVMLNGSLAGRMMFDGRQHSIEKIIVPQGLLREGANVVTLIAEGGLSDVSLVDYVRVTYRHVYTADQDALLMTISDQAGAVAAQSQTIDGFSNRSIRVVDITNDGEPQELIGQIEEQKDGRFAVTVDVAGDTARTLFAFTEERVKAPVSTAANQYSFWRESSHAADLLIITHRDFLASLAPLKALRQRQGFDVEVVDIEDIYDEFSFGERRPQAVKEFLSLATATWKRAPRFVLFVGDASFDPRDYLGAGDLDFVPTKLIDTIYLETASDDWFADFNDDGLAEMFVGRLPVRTASETAALVSKIAGYDSTDGKSVIAGRSVLLVADKNDGFNFEQASEQLRALVPAGVGVQEIFRGRLDDAAAKEQLIEAINAGKSIVNYIGHGSISVWRDLFTNEDARSLNNRQRLPLFVTMTCLNGFFHDPVIGSLGEGLLKSERGGAIAVWASSGLTDPAQQTAMNRQAYRLLFDAAHNLTLGEVTARAKSAVRDKDVRRTWILLGDPTSRLR